MKHLEIAAARKHGEKSGSEKHQISLWKSQELQIYSTSASGIHSPTSPAEADGVGRPGMCGWLRMAMRMVIGSMVYGL